MRLQRHVRIKVFDKSKAFAALNIEIPHYKFDEINKFEAYTYTKDGRKIKVEDTFIKKIGYLRSLSFTFPAVEDGVIIEYKYKLERSTYQYIDPWTFQNELYTLKSIYSIILYEDFTYNVNRYNIPREKAKPARIMYPEEYKYSEAKYTWELDSLPAIKDEPLIGMSSDYISAIQINLIAAYFRMNESSFVRDWSAIGNLLNDWIDDFCTDSSLVDSVARAICLPEDEAAAKLQKLYAYVRDDIKVLYDNGIYLPDSGIVPLVDSSFGSLSEKNILLTKLLSRMGIESYPIAIASRDYRDLNLSEYNINQFNRYVCCVIQGKDTLVLSTDSRLTPTKFLSSSNLVKHGLLIKKDSSQIIDIPNPKRSNGRQTTTSLTLNSDGTADCEISMKISGALIERFDNILGDTLDQEELADRLLEDINIQYSLNEFDYFADIDGDSLIFNIGLHLPDYCESIADNMFFASYIFPTVFNPFSNADRYFPVDFKFPQYEYHIAKVAYPDGYELSDKPLEMSYKIEGASFLRSFMEFENSYQVTTHFKIGNEIFMPDQYLELKEMLDNISAAGFDKSVISPAQ